MRVAVIGAGSWGSAVAHLLGHQGHIVTIWARRSEVADSINNHHTNCDYLKGHTLSNNVSATTNLSAAVSGAQTVVLVTASSYVRQTAKKMAPYLANDVPVIVLSKGVEKDTGFLMTQILEDVLGNQERIAALSGPNHAEEVIKGLPTATVVASFYPETAAFFQELFHTDVFRTYVSSDVVGVELCAAAKNIIALAVGMSYGVGLGDNSAAVIMTRGLAEIARLMNALGGDPQTAMGLAGMGDLNVTCMSTHSRNRSFGMAFAKGESLEEFEARTHMIVEGAQAAESVLALAHTHGVEMPITTMVVRLLRQELTPKEAVELLTSRDAGTEFYGFDER